MTETDTKETKKGEENKNEECKWNVGMGTWITRRGHGEGRRWGHHYGRGSPAKLLPWVPLEEDAGGGQGCDPSSWKGI